MLRQLRKDGTAYASLLTSRSAVVGVRARSPFRGRGGGCCYRRKAPGVRVVMMIGRRMATENYLYSKSEPLAQDLADHEGFDGLP